MLFLEKEKKGAMQDSRSKSKENGKLGASVQRVGQRRVSRSHTVANANRGTEHARILVTTAEHYELHWHVTLTY